MLTVKYIPAKFGLRHGTFISALKLECEKMAFSDHINLSFGRHICWFLKKFASLSLPVLSNLFHYQPVLFLYTFTCAKLQVMETVVVLHIRFSRGF